MDRRKASRAVALVTVALAVVSLVLQQSAAQAAAVIVRHDDRHQASTMDADCSLQEAIYAANLDASQHRTPRTS